MPERLTAKTTIGKQENNNVKTYPLLKRNRTRALGASATPEILAALLAPLGDARPQPRQRNPADALGHGKQQCVEHRREAAAPNRGHSLANEHRPECLEVQRGVASRLPYMWAQVRAPLQPQTYLKRL